jgi:hypothetical protein
MISHGLTLTLLDYNKKRKEPSGERLEHWISGQKKCTLAQGLVALNQLTHTNCFWGFLVCGQALDQWQKNWEFGCIYGFVIVLGRWKDLGKVTWVFYLTLNLIAVSKLGLLRIAVSGIGVWLS